MYYDMNILNKKGGITLALNDLGNRIRQVRKLNNLSMDSFGEKVGISKVSVSRIEAGINNPSAQTVMLICKEFGLNEEWLKTGEGEMYCEVSQEEEIAQIVNTLLAEKPKSFRMKLVHYISQMTDEELEYFHEFLIELTSEEEDEETE